MRPFQIKKTMPLLGGLKYIIKMYFVAPFNFNVVVLALSRSTKQWNSVEKKQTKNIVKGNCRQEKYAQKYQISDWLKESQKYEIYINEEEFYELIFLSHQSKAKDFKKHYCNVMLQDIW